LALGTPFGQKLLFLRWIRLGVKFLFVSQVLRPNHKTYITRIAPAMKNLPGAIHVSA